MTHWALSSSLSPEEMRRYSRQILLPEIGIAGQERLKASRVLIVGAGGLGSPVALYLAAAGVGNIGIIDFDCVEVSNLHRQVLYTHNCISASKVISAQQKIQSLNPSTDVVAHNEKFSRRNAGTLIGKYDLIVDGSDNFSTKMLVNDVCIKHKKPLVYGSVFRFEGQVSVFAPHLGAPCFRCLYPSLPSQEQTPSCAQAGVIGPVCGLVGCIQAAEAIKVLLKVGQPLFGELLRCDVLNMRFQNIEFERDLNCVECSGKDREIDTTIEQTHSSLMEAQMTGLLDDDISVEEVCEMMKSGQKFVFVDVRNMAEQQICKIDGTKHIPMQELESRIGELKKDELIVLHCHHGGRSRRATEFLKSKGFTQVKNLAGGIDRWADVVDPSMAKY